MKDKEKTKEQLINELEETRQRIVNLEALGHKREDEKKLESADKYINLAESLSELIYCADPKTFEATYVNSTIESLYGYTVAEWLNNPSLWENLIHPDDKEMVLAELAEARKNLANAIIEYRIVRKDKTIRWVEDHISWEKDQHGKAFSMNGVMYDVSERKHLEQQLIRHRDHLEELVEEHTAELESANEQLLQEITKHKRTEETLQESEEKLKRIFESVIDGITVTDLNGVITNVNDAVLRISGAGSKDDLIGKSSFESIASRDQQRALADMQELAQKGVVGKGEYTLIRVDGSEYPAEISANVLKDTEGNLAGFVSIIRDITECKQAEEALKASEQEKTSILRSISELVVHQDNEMRILWANKVALESVDLLPEEIIGRYCYEVWPQRSEPCIGCPVLKSRETGQPQEAEIATPDGKIWFIRGDPVRDANGDITGVVESTLDITERKKAEEEIQIQRARFESIFERSLEGIVTLDINNNILEANAGFENIYGYKQEEIIGKRLDDLIVPERFYYGEAKELDKMALDGIIGYETVRKRKDGTEINISLSAGPIKMGEEVRGRFVIFRDITERKMLEEEYQKTVRLESVGTLAGGIAHDFNNFLTGIMGNIGLAKRYVEPKSKAEDRLLEAEKASLRAKDLTQQLLTFARGGAPIRKLVSITELIRDSATFALRGSNTGCDFSLPDDLCPVKADEGQINQVITNIVLNADEAMPEGGILNIGAKNTVIQKGGALPLPKGNYIEITIADHCVGIPQEHLSKIFDPYFTTKQKGSGLGLATAYSIVKNHGGYITAESTPTVGTTFHIYLPASKKRMPRKEKEAAAQPALLGKGRILVMDDDEIIRQLLDDELTSVGYEVELTVDGAEAIEHYRKARESGQPFDAVILDLTIPGGMGGKEAINKLLEIDPNVKAIVSSGYSTDPIMSDFKDYGFSGVVAKPYKVEQLEKTLHSLLKEKK